PQRRQFCGLPENYPEAAFDDDHLCSFCRSYDNYKDRVAEYFKTPADLKALLESGRSRATGKYDCLVLLSGGKDSTYAVAKVQEMGFRVLAFTLDNGYISAEAIENAKKVVQQLGVDHVIGTTPAMNEIFVDSLQRHCNVCDGCFKTIYTLSTQIALKEQIPFIVTGLSRGQFFETRLTEELFTSDRIDTEKIDQIILNARKAYHQVDDAVKQLLDTKAFEDEATFEKVQYVDFYRYTDVHLNEMLAFLKERINWQRPSDTGRSTNCLINQAGIFVHKKELGYSNYAYPYSWDVRIGHKNRDEALEEINEALDVPTVQRILDEIGYTQQQRELEAKEKKLVGYYTTTDTVDEEALEKHLRQSLPAYMLPSQLIRLEQLPLTANGKVDFDQLPLPDNVKKLADTPYVAPRDEFEELVHETWKEVLVVEKVGVNDNFMSIGGDSLSGIRIISRLNEELELELPVMAIFQQPTIAQLAQFVAETIQRLLAEMDE
ncbi:MAG: phosphopantetheine-binding protein, partial [Bacteroidota bacterium]